MADDRNRTLRRLAKSYRITFRLPSDDLPEAHSSTFRNIKKLGNQEFDSYSESVNIRSQEEPWTEQTKHRAEWLAKRASRLFYQQRNEAGWRFSLENDVLRRFSVELACPKCRARVWRSEIEATLDESDNLAQDLEQRKRDRKHCQCAPETRPQDYYEIGTNPLFDDRTQELIIHDDILRSELPKQEPDRIYGLQATRNFEDLLSRSVPCTSIRPDRSSVGELVRSSPFKAVSDPLLFPFLVLEAKSESSSSGFDDIQTQTAFPIWSLLKLQEDLQSHTADVDSSFKPLVWFLASRGDAWRVYGCYLMRGVNNEPTRYDITLLWNGSVAIKDSALQLILIVDYILDWARDVYRPSILRQLKSIATGKAYDQVSLTDDSDVFSMRRNISNWIPAPPSTIDALALDEDQSPPVVALEHQNLLPISIPNTKLGSIRSAFITEFHFVGLYLTQSNVTSLLRLVAGHSQNKEKSAKAARELVNFITRWDEMLVLTGADLNDLEYIWTGDMRSDEDTMNSSSSEDFYVLLESRCFISSSWDITKEITCLAISRPAFEILRSYASFKNRHRPAESLPKIVRPCSMAVLRECVECLRAGSPWQVLLSAMSSTLVSIYPVPERKRADFTPPVDLLEFGYIRSSRVKPFILKFLKFGQRKPTRRYRPSLDDNGQRLHKNFTEHGAQSNSGRRTKDLSFRRLSERRVRNCEQMHGSDTCARCRQSCKDELLTRNLPTTKPAVVLTYGLILVESLEEHNSSREKDTRHDLCLFVVDNSTSLEEENALPTVVKDILQTDMLYHTIRHPLFDNNDCFPATVWNLPLPYRPCTEDQRADAMNWRQELLGQPITITSRPKDQATIWDLMQMLLRCLSFGYSYLAADLAVRRFCQEFHKKRKEQIEKQKPLPFYCDFGTPSYPTLCEFCDWIDQKNGRKKEKEYEVLFPPPQLKLRGDIVAESSKTE